MSVSKIAFGKKKKILFQLTTISTHMLATKSMLWLWLLFIINSYQHPFNILATQHFTHILHIHNVLWCWLLDKINYYDSYQHPLNIIPTYYQHLSNGEPEDKLWGWVAYGLIVDKMWGICWFCTHKLPTFCRSCHCTTAPESQTTAKRSCLWRSRFTL